MTGRSTGVLPRLTSLRAFAAAAVFVYHLDRWGVVPVPGNAARPGFVGVSFFFVLSGFVLAWGTRPGLRARTFYRRRFARVWPSHVVVLVAACVVPVVAVDRDVRSAVPNLLLVQAWAVDPAVVYGMNGVSWSLSCEAFFYLLFPLAAWAVHRLPLGWSWSLAGGGLLLALIAGLLAPTVAEHAPPVRATEFLLGLVAGTAVRDGWRPRTPGPVVLVVLAAGLAAAATVPPAVANALVAGPFLLVVLYAAVRDLAGRPGWLLTRRWMVFAGEASFAFYLVHELVLLNVQDALAAPPAVVAAVVTALAVLAAVLLHVLVERPANRWLRDRSPSVALAVPPAGGPGTGPHEGPGRDRLSAP